MMTIYYLDDDWMYADSVIGALQSKVDAARLQWQIRRIDTESAFIETVGNIEAGKLPRPAAVILDVMVSYASPNPNVPGDTPSAPPYDRAGIRCVELIRRKFPSVPIILFTILDAEDIPPHVRSGNVQFVNKDPNNVATVFSLLRRAIA